MREARLKSMKEENGSDAPSICTLCPTRWTVRAQPLASIIGNYQELQQLWEEAPLAVADTAMKARIRGVATLMTTFQFLFSLHLSEMILQHTDKLSQTLQNPQLSSAEGHEITMLTVRTLQSIRSDSSFELFWLKVEQRRENLEILKRLVYEGSGRFAMSRVMLKQRFMLQPKIGIDRFNLRLLICL